VLTIFVSPVKARTALLRQVKSLLVTAPEPVRTRWAAIRGTEDLMAALAATRPEPAITSVQAATGQGLRHLARRYQHLAAEIDELEQDLAALVDAANPALRAAFGIGTVTAAQLLVTAGDNPERLSSEAAFAALCGTAPIPASSGKTYRHRLSRGGDPQANAALHQIALVRMTTDPGTGLYAARRRAWGKTGREIMRCLKRAIAQQVWHLLVHPDPEPDAVSSAPRASSSASPSPTSRHGWAPAPPGSPNSNEASGRTPNSPAPTNSSSRRLTPIGASARWPPRRDHHDEQAQELHHPTGRNP